MKKSVAVTGNDGVPMVVQNPPPKDYSIPMQDETGVIPEFVNISRKKQIVAVPGNPGNSFRIERFGILKGAQWREMFQAGKTFGNHPPLKERVAKDGEFDPKYLLTKEQMIEEIKSLTNPDMIDALVAHAVMGPGGQRLPDDRTDIVALAHNRSYELRKKAEARSKVLGQ